MLKALFYFALFLFPFSIVFVVFNLLPRGWEFSHAVIICLYAVILVLWMSKRQGWGAALTGFSGVVFFALGVESVGVKTGWPFGSYHYTQALGFQVLGVPAAILIAWYAAAVSSLGVVAYFSSHQPGSCRNALYAALLIVSLDIVLEPTASFIKYFWMWRGGRIPFINYASWFGIGWILVFFLQRPPLEIKNEWKHVPAAVYGMQWILFVLTDLRQGFILSVLISLAIAAGTLALVRKGEECSVI